MMPTLAAAMAIKYRPSATMLIAPSPQWTTLTNCASGGDWDYYEGISNEYR